MKIQEYKLNMNFNYLVILAILIALGVAGRLLPHPPNFTPMAAIALFAGFIFLNFHNNSPMFYEFNTILKRFQIQSYKCVG